MKIASSHQTVLHRAMEISDPAKRAAYLDTACGGDEELRQEVESLLDARLVTTARKALKALKLLARPGKFDKGRRRLNKLLSSKPKLRGFLLSKLTSEESSPQLVGTFLRYISLSPDMWKEFASEILDVELFGYSSPSKQLWKLFDELPSKDEKLIYRKLLVSKLAAEKASPEVQCAILHYFAGTRDVEILACRRRYKSGFVAGAKPDSVMP